MQQSISSGNLRIIFGLKLKNYRTQKNMSLQNLSAKSGLAVSYISEIESGKKYPKPEKMLQLSHALDVSFDDLVSLQVNKTLDPLTTLMNSALIKEFPFDLFGISARDILNLFSDAPQKATAFLQTFLEISQAYDMSVENFLFAALRTYQKLNSNYFPEIEESAQKFTESKNLNKKLPDFESLKMLLLNDYNYIIDEISLTKTPELSFFRSVFKKTPQPTIFLNPQLLPSQKAFILGRELGFAHLRLKSRPLTSSWLKVESFDQLINNFKASYFAGALLLPHANLSKDIKELTALKTWDSNYFLKLLEHYQATPEMFLYRLSQLLPGIFDLKKLFYLRFTGKKDSVSVSLTKELNMTDELVPYGLGLDEHYCRRWLPLKLLAEMNSKESEKSKEPLIGIQKVRFIESGSTFVMISLTRPLLLSSEKNSAMTIGFKISGKEKFIFKFVNDPSIPVVDVNETCERCPLPKEQCGERMAAPKIYNKKQKILRREEALNSFLK